MYDTVKTLDQTVDVDYYVPGCAPEAHQIAAVLDVVTAALKGEGELPPKGSVVGVSPKTCCDECERVKEEKKISSFQRIWEFLPDPEKCLLEQGLICMGPATHAGCGARCTGVGMPCRGCYGAPDGVVDQGAKMLSTVASIVDAPTPEEIAEIAATRPRPGGHVLSLRSPQFAAQEGEGLMKKVTVDPITRLEGHGKIDIFLDDEGEVPTSTCRSPSCAASSSSASAGRSRTCRT